MTNYVQIQSNEISGSRCHSIKSSFISKFTAYRLVSLFLVLTVASIIMLFECFQPDLLRKKWLCCDGYHREGSNELLYDQYFKDHVRYKHTKRRLPGCIIVGVRKGGTRALIEFLNLHPKIITQKREMHFFDDDDNYSLGIDWYRKKMPFSFPNQITIEKTPGYFTEENSPERVHNMNSSMKMLVVVREPTERTISDYMQVHSKREAQNLQHERFEELVMDYDTGEISKAYNPIMRSIYHVHLKNWLNYFPLGQFHFVDGDNLIKDPLAELRKVEKFLNLEARISENQFYFNETRGFYCIKKDKFPRCLAKSKGRKHVPVNPIVLKKLRDFFRPHNQKFYDMIGQDMGWP